MVVKKHIAWMGGEFRGEWIHVYVWLSPWGRKELDMTERLHFNFQRLEMFCKTEDPFTLLPHCLSFSILPFDFDSSL